MREQPAHLRTLNIVSIAIFAFYLVLITLDLVHIAPTIGVVGIALVALVGYLLADFLSGFVHFLGDTFGDASTPFFGPAFIFPFREHHVEPEAITHHDFVETNGHNCLVSIPVMMIMTHILAKFAFTSALMGFVFGTLYFLVLGVLATNQFHKWAHMKNAPRYIRILQRYRCILSPKHHRIHHTAPYTRYFCITTGWLNGALDRINFFSKTKAALRKIPFMLKAREEYQANSK